MQEIIMGRPGLAENVLISRGPPSPTAGPKHVLIHVTARPIQSADFLFIAGH